MYHIEQGIWQGGCSGDLSEEIQAIITLNDKCLLNIKEKPVCHISMPIIDGLFPGMGWLYTAVELISALRKRNLNVYIHCLAGQSRSAMVVAAYLIKIHACSVDQALETIAASNPEINPAPAFMRALKEYREQVFNS